MGQDFEFARDPHVCRGLPLCAQKANPGDGEVAQSVSGRPALKNSSVASPLGHHMPYADVILVLRLALVALVALVCLRWAGRLIKSIETDEDLGLAV